MQPTAATLLLYELPNKPSLTKHASTCQGPKSCVSVVFSPCIRLNSTLGVSLGSLCLGRLAVVSGEQTENGLSHCASAEGFITWRDPSGSRLYSVIWNSYASPQRDVKTLATGTVCVAWLPNTQPLVPNPAISNGFSRFFALSKCENNRPLISAVCYVTLPRQPIYITRGSPKKLSFRHLIHFVFCHYSRLAALNLALQT